jgi:hypothetical protein
MRNTADGRHYAPDCACWLGASFRQRVVRPADKGPIPDSISRLNVSLGFVLSTYD